MLPTEAAMSVEADLVALEGSEAHAAGRPKDFEFCRALVRHNLITADVVRLRAPTIDPRVDAGELATRVERLLDSTDAT